MTLGETMGLARATELGTLDHVSHLAVGIGGAESNVAIGVARLGGRSTWMGRVGADSLGRRVLRELRAESVTVLAVTDPGANTGFMLKERPTGSTTRVTYYRAGSAGSRLEPGDVDEAAIAGCGILHVSGITLALSATAAAAIDRAVDIARSNGVTVSFDVNHRSSLWVGRDPALLYRSLVERADIVFAGDDEARIVVDDGTPIELAKRLHDLGPATAVIKLGAEGCVALIDGDEFASPAFRVNPVDTVGAGDAFVAGFLTGVLEGLGPVECVDLAQRCGAFAVMGPGDWESLPRRADLASLDSTGDPVAR